MAKSRSPAKKRQRKQSRRTPSRLRRKSVFPKKTGRYIGFGLKYSLKTVGIIAIVVGLAAGYYVFKPRIKVSSLKPINPRSTFSTPFVISNIGNITLYNIQTKFNVGPTKPLMSERGNPEVYDNTIVSKDIVTELPPTKEMTVFCNFTKFWKIDTVLFDSEVEVILSYRYFWIIPNTSSFKFVTIINQRGHVYWLPSSK